MSAARNQAGCCRQQTGNRASRGIGATLAGVAVATLAVVALLAARLAPFLPLGSETDARASGSGAATQPCC
ncbi:MAG TPA: hypothetical protein VGB85_33270 [Nannocystis sp.]|jgi:hypothetical protein